MRAKKKKEVFLAQLLLRALLLCVACLCSPVFSESVSEEGHWAPSTVDACRMHLCTPNNYTWVMPRTSSPSAPPPPFFNSSTACSLLEKLNIKHVYFHGDSLIRQMFQAFLITLSGDFAKGSFSHEMLHNPRYVSKCHGRYQFEIICSQATAPHDRPPQRTCGGRVHVWGQGRPTDPSDHVFPSHTRDGRSLVLWSEGSHPLYPIKILGSNRSDDGRFNSSAYSDKFLSHYKFCNNSNSSVHSLNFSNMETRVVWVSTHYRPGPIVHPTENNKYSNLYNREMRNKMQGNDCPCCKLEYIDVYNMTKKLFFISGLNHSIITENMVVDHLHYSMNVNLIKAQIILHHLYDTPDLFL